MSVFFDVCISQDGYLAGPNQSEQQGLGEGGEELHDWRFKPELQTDRDREINEAWGAGVGGAVMGRNMFGPIRGEWKGDWRGWWGENPPYGYPVYVLTHHPREPLEMEGGTTFHFVTDGFDAAFEQARAAAGDKHVQILGGGSTIQQALNDGHVDWFRLHIAPRVLGRGVLLFEDVAPTQLEIVDSEASPHVTHVEYRVRPSGSGTGT
jgi:dihydrofolate reductase